MLKPFLTVILGVFFFSASAQKKTDTLVYYLKNSGVTTAVKDSAEFFLLIMPPDTTVDEKLFVVKEFYRNGKLRLAAKSYTNTLNTLKFQGPQIIFFQNGHKMVMTNFDDGMPVGDQIFYYPNGKLYSIKTYGGYEKPLLIQCNDTTGNVIAQKGRGRWIIYDANFKDIYGEGAVTNGVQEGFWKEKLNDSVGYEKIFDNGKLISTKTIDYKNQPSGEIYLAVDKNPEFPGGLEKFFNFLARTIHYPADARQDNIQGKVIINFIVEKDGTLNDFKVVRGIGHGCDEAAMKAIQLSSPWIPAMKNGKPVRASYTLPISFTNN